MTLKEIETKKAELRKKINEAKTEKELEELRKQAEELNKEVPSEENNGTISHEEERALIADTNNLEQRKVEITNIMRPHMEEVREKVAIKDLDKVTILLKEFRDVLKEVLEIQI